MAIIADRHRYIRCLDGITNESDLSAGAQCLVEARNRLLASRNKYAKWSKSDYHSNDAFSKTNDQESPTFRLASSHSPNGKDSRTDISTQYSTTHMSENFIESKAHTLMGEDRWIHWGKTIHSRLKVPHSQIHSSSSSNHEGSSEHLRRWASELQKRKEMAFKRNRLQVATNIQLNDIIAKRKSIAYQTQMRAFERGSDYANFHQTFKNRIAIESPITSRILRHRRMKRSPYRLITNTVTRSDNEIIEVKRMRNSPKLLDAYTSKTPIQRVAKLIRTIVNGEEPNNNWTLSYNKLIELRKNMNAKRKLPGAKVYDLRLYDIVVGNDKPTRAPGKNVSVPDFLTMAFDLIDAFAGKTTRGDNWNVKVLSPRIAPILPEKEDLKERRHLLSPSVLPFYNDDSPDTIAPLPKVLEATGMSEKDRQAVLEMVMDVSGAKQAVETSLDILEKMNFFGFEAEVFEATERLSELFLSMEKSFNQLQNKEIKRHGYTFLESEQIKHLFDGHGLKNPNDVDFDLDEYAKLNRKQREEALWRRIERIAFNGSKHHTRDKRQLISVLNPVVLAPYMFAPVVGITILGPVVLSPNIFSPLLLNPSLLSPFVLSPGVAMPFILSPYLLSPYILTPIFAAPFILSPYVLSPNVLNPYVLSPLILSPYVLCPDILSPQALGGPILSPSMFSPSVLTDSYLMASVLSPTFMS